MGFFGERDILNEEVIRLTAADLWLESSTGKVTKLRKKLR
jgi:hypothetical protein